MLDSLFVLFDTTDFPPRWQCGDWTTIHGWVHVVSDLAIFGAYVTIPLSLLWLVRRRPIPFSRIILLFGLFIVSCGITHLIESMIFWWPAYRLSAVAKVVTACVSWGTVLALIPMLPRALELPNLQREVEDRREAEQRLRRAVAKLERVEQRLELAVSASHVGIWDIDLETGELFASSTCCELLGVTGEPTSFEEMLAEVGADSARAALLILTSRRGHVGEIDIELKRDGKTSPIWLRLQGQSFDPDANGRPRRMSGAITDITPRRLDMDLLRTAIEAAPSGFVMVDRDGRISLVNRRIVEMFGYEREELLGESIERLVPEAVVDAHVDHRERYMEDPSSRAMGKGRDLFGRRKDGVEIPVEIGLNPIVTHRGLEVLGSVFDITERKRAERRIAETNATLARSNRDLDEFAHVISHDLKAPLRGISSISQWLAEDYGDSMPPEAHEHLALLRERARRMQDLIDGVLKYSRAQREPLRPELVPLREVIDQVLADIETPSGVTVEIECPTGADVRCDRTRLRQVLQNLIENAVRHVDPESGAVSIEARCAGDFCEFRVTDNGPGIDAKHHERIFRIFQTIRTDGSSTGVGLAIVKNLVERMGGEVRVESTLGAGATFVVMLPRV